MPAQTRTLPALTRGSVEAAKALEGRREEQDEPQRQAPEADREQRPSACPGRILPALLSCSQRAQGSRCIPANHTAPENPQCLGETPWVAPSWTDRRTAPLQAVLTEEIY